MPRTKLNEKAHATPQYIPAAQGDEDLPVPLPAPETRSLPTLWCRPGQPASEWPTNFDLRTVDGRAGLINAGRPPTWTPLDGGEFDVVAHNFVCYPDQVTDQETGELKDISRVCLCSNDGTLVKFASEFMHRNLHALMLMFSPEEWAQGIRLHCYTAKSRRPGRTPYGAFRVLGLAKPPESTGETGE